MIIDIYCFCKIRFVFKLIHLDMVIINYSKKILFNLIKYNPIKLINYLLKYNNQIDWKDVYYFLYKEKKIYPPYTYPNNCENEWLNAIINRTKFNEVDEKNHASFKILKNGKLMAKGRNFCGQLGLGDNKNRDKFELVPNVKDVVRVFSECGSTMLLLKTGEIMSCGLNDKGQGGTYNNTNTSKFEILNNSHCDIITNVVNIFFFRTSRIILLKTGEIMSCGFNLHGQLGQGNNNNSYQFRYIKNKNGENIKNVIDISCGCEHVIILLKTGEIMTCGRNGYGQLGLGDEKDRNEFELVSGIKDVIKVFATYYQTAILLKTGEIMTCGDNRDGELGLNDSENRNKFELVHDFRVSAVSSKNFLVLKDIINIFSNGTFLILLLKNGKLMASGSNLFGRLGLGSTENHMKFILIPGVKNVENVICKDEHTELILKNGKKMKAGLNYGKFFTYAK